MMSDQNRIAEIEQQLLLLRPERHYFEEYYLTCKKVSIENLEKLSSKEILGLWTLVEQYAKHRIHFFRIFLILIHHNCKALKLLFYPPEQVIPYLQSQFYMIKERELESEKQELNHKLEHYGFDTKINELGKKSMQLFHAELATRYQWKKKPCVF